MAELLGSFDTMKIKNVDGKEVLVKVDVPATNVYFADGTALAAKQFYVAQPTPPVDTKLLWIDTTPTTGGLKYYNGTAWKSVPVQYTV